MGNMRTVIFGLGCLLGGVFLANYFVAEAGAQQIEMRVETLSVILPVMMILAIVVLIVLGLLMPWFGYRIANSMRQTRDCLMEVNKHLDLATQQLAAIAGNTYGKKIPSKSNTLTSNEE